jgi:hypothetical protein
LPAKEEGRKRRGNCRNAPNQNCHFHGVPFVGVVSGQHHPSTIGTPPFLREAA